MERIKQYFEEQIKTDPALAEAYKESKLNDCWKYITSQAKASAKNGCAMIEDSVVYKWARDFMLGDIPQEIQTVAPAKTEEEVEIIEEGTAEEIAAVEPEELPDVTLGGKEIAEGTYEITSDLHFEEAPKNEKLVIEKVEEEPAEEELKPAIQKEKKNDFAELKQQSLFDDLF